MKNRIWSAVTPTVGWAKQQFEARLENGVRLIVHGGDETWHAHARNPGRHIVWMASEPFFSTHEAAQAAAELWVSITPDTLHRPRSPKLRRWITRWSGDRRQTPPHDRRLKK